MISRLTILISVAAVASGFPSDVSPCNGTSAELFPHPKECQLYYNCSITDSPRLMPGGQGVTECKYPLLYDETSETCMEEVNCGSRKLKKNAYEISCPDSVLTTQTPSTEI
ncbi:hypothetical protein MAR_014428 [Mya arenaria]|uniref:Chitin-binding type-2 domain-containing protein n=1 Tax=Mya arenaria TaxID=6604 RepID=A0ABY7G5E1_MYAAR|nr:hypothetical protein MAR_014428 [Mya arenaria]